MINVISQSLGLDVVNINAYTKFYKNIPNGLELSTFFHEQSGDKIFTEIKFLIIGHTMKVNLQFQMTFLGSCIFFRSLMFRMSKIISIKHGRFTHKTSQIST